MRVLLIDSTRFPLRTTSLAAKICHEKGSVLPDDFSTANKAALIRKIKAWKHDSILEHASFTFLVEGVSRALSHQLVRHRIASYAQRSQRHVFETNTDSEAGGFYFNYVIPASISNNSVALKAYKKLMKDIAAVYAFMTEDGIPAEDARYVLPNACHTSLIVTMNARELRTFFRLRLSSHAQWEIRQMAGLMLKEVKEAAPVLFEDVNEDGTLTAPPEKVQTDVQCTECQKIVTTEKAICSTSDKGQQVYLCEACLEDAYHSQGQIDDKDKK